MPYQDGPDSIYGFTKLCLILKKRVVGSAEVWEYTTGRVCIKMSSKFKMSLMRRRIGRLHEDPWKEIKIMALLQRGGVHPNLNTMLEAMEDDEYLFSVLDFCDDELFAVIAAEGGFSEAKAQKVFTEMLKGVAYMHQMGMAHLDISLENTMMKNDCAVVIDFGMAQHIPKPDRADGYFGKLYYMHPLMFSHKSAKKAGERMRDKWSMIESDIWSLGVCLFTMLIGGPPWENPSAALDQRFRVITEGQLEMVLGKWGITHLSPLCVDFLQKILSLNVKVGRLTTLQAILQHPWMQRFLQSGSRIPVLTTAPTAAGGGAIATGHGATAAAATLAHNETRSSAPAPLTTASEGAHTIPVAVASRSASATYAAFAEAVFEEAGAATVSTEPHPASGATKLDGTAHAAARTPAAGRMEEGAPVARRAATATSGSAWRSHDSQPDQEHDATDGGHMDIC